MLPLIARWGWEIATGRNIENYYERSWRLSCLMFMSDVNTRTDLLLAVNNDFNMVCSFGGLYVNVSLFVLSSIILRITGSATKIKFRIRLIWKEIILLIFKLNFCHFLSVLDKSYSLY